MFLYELELLSYAKAVILFFQALKRLFKKRKERSKPVRMRIIDFLGQNKTNFESHKACFVQLRHVLIDKYAERPLLVI